MSNHARILPVTCSDEFALAPHTCRVEINDALAGQILMINKVVVEHELYSATVFNYAPVWSPIRSIAGSVEPRVECVELVVTSDDFYWQGALGEGSSVVTTERCKISDFRGRR